MVTETRTRTQAEEPTSASAHPPHASPPLSPRARSTNPGQTPPVDGKLFYGYLFNKDRTVKPLLDDLLRAIGKYIVRTLSFPADRGASRRLPVDAGRDAIVVGPPLY